MPTVGQQARRFAWCAALFFGALAPLAGCAGWDVRGSAFKDEPRIGRKTSDPSFAPNRAASLYGFSTKARQIEQNLGIE